MKNLSIMTLYAILFMSSAFITTRHSSAQTEGFHVKTPVEKISGSAANLLKDVMNYSRDNPGRSIPKGLICKAECYLAVPSIDVDSFRSDFSGTGLLACRTADSGGLTPPLFYTITNIESFEEGGGGVIVLVTDRKGVKSILGDQIRLDHGNSEAGKTGQPSDAESSKPFVSYTVRPGEGIRGFDAAGSTLRYESGDTFKAYQQTVDPIDVMLFTIDAPPPLRGYQAALEEWAKGCNKQ